MSKQYHEFSIHENIYFSICDEPFLHPCFWVHYSYTYLLTFSTMLLLLLLLLMRFVCRFAHALMC